MEQVRGSAPSPLPPEYIETIEIPDDEPTRCQQLRALTEKCSHYREKIKSARFLMNSSNVSISDRNKVPLNENDMDHNSAFVQPSKRHTAKISVKHNLNDSVVSENTYDNSSVDDNEVKQGVIIPIKRPPPTMLKRTGHFIQDLIEDK
ncbi:hypothetical protein AVEN_173646-1 [Araneus ventricosus]|uniref:Uncharacterized protein n=1 Tax=Araneus ventricosus TaxID=182803 RepID=A0A4Y2TJS3_ARAVE|nr:hypothetical protein AVEN_173646-1 [Araneus ventricosus]